MGQRVSLEWNVGESADDVIFSTPAWRSFDWDAIEWSTPSWLNTADAESWEPLQNIGQARNELWHTLRTLSIFCLALLLVTSTVSTPELAQRVMARAGIEEALKLEQSAWRADDRALYNTLVDEAIELRWLNEWRDLWRLDVAYRQEFGTTVSDIELLDDLVAARVTIMRPSVDWWRSSPYRERRFYRETSRGWVRTLPDETYWGREQTLETEYIVFTFAERDADNVLPIARQVEQVYLESRRIFNIGPPATDQKLYITVAPEMIRRWYYNRNQVLITSPVVSKIPAELTEADYLAQTLTDLLAYRAIETASVNNQANFYRWGMMVWGLSGWLRSDLVGERSPWDRQAITHFHELVTRPVHLEAATDWQGDDPPTRERLMAQYVAAESIVDYIVAAFGREQLPVLLNALSEYLQWDSVISGMFGISRAEFEAGWNDHIAQNY